MRKNFHGTLKLNGKSGEIDHIEIFFDDQTPEEKKEIEKIQSLSEKMLVSAFGKNFDPMTEEFITDYPV